MSNSDVVAKFRSSSEPLLALWSVGDAQAHGSLMWRDGKPVLVLFVEIEGARMPLGGDPDLDIFRLTKPPTQPTIVGRVREYGFLTLEGCARTNVAANPHFGVGRTIYELEFWPTAIWIGAPKTEIENNVIWAEAHDGRLGGFFGSPGLKTYESYDDNAKSAFDALHNPETIWAVYGPDHDGIELGDTGFTLRLSTSQHSRFSATEGHTFRSLVKLSIRSPASTSMYEAEKALFRLEEILSVFALEPVSFQFRTFYSDIDKSISLAWRLGEDLDLLRPPMRHQILVDIRDSDVLRSACSTWFGASETVRLSRWLFARALKETTNGMARFLAVAQAFEVLGRELSPSERMPKDRRKRAAELVQDALSKEFEDGFVERMVGLVQSSNAASFRGVLQHMISMAAQYVGYAPDQKLADFCKKVSDTRNAIVHMTDNDQNKLNEAFSAVTKLSLQLCTWYAVLQAQQLNLPITNINQFLFNNSNARHGLPNELLERH